MNRRQFWLLDGAWPAETVEWVFLGQAIQRVGRMLDPDHWQDDDPSHGIEPTEWGHQWAHEVRLRGSESRRPTEEMRNAFQTQMIESAMRASAAFRRIIKECQAGTLTTGVRPVAGGEILPVDLSVWKTEYHRLSDRLAFCQMRIDDPFAYGTGGIGKANESGMGYIFIRRAGLDQITWPTQEAMRAEFPEGVPPPKELLQHESLRSRVDRLTAGFDLHSTVFRAAALVAKSAKPRRGRQKGETPSFDWAQFNEQALKLLEDRGGFDPSVDNKWTRAALIEEMATWCEHNFTRVPVTSTIGSHVDAVYSTFIAGRSNN